MVGGAPALLRLSRTRLRQAAFVALAGLLIAYYFTYKSYTDLSLWVDIGLFDLLLMPAVFALVLLALPLRRARGLPALVAALVVGSVLADLADLDVLANFSKLATMTAIGFWFLELFPELSWVVLIALIIPWVDAYSVWRGPTGHIVQHHPGVFRTLSFTFVLPGDPSSAQLGLPDLLFFALFVAAAAKFGLRSVWTWTGMVVALGSSIAITVWLEIAAVPALPALSVGLLVPNGDLIWRRLRRR